MIYLFYETLRVMRMNYEDKTQYWLQIADYDLETAKSMLETKRYLYVGFMCHQVIEKALKACYVTKNNQSQPPYIHRLAKLASLSGVFNDLEKFQLELLATLEPLNIAARYPSSKDNIYTELSFDKCESIIQKTEELYKWIKEKL